MVKRLLVCVFAVTTIFVSPARGLQAQVQSVLAYGRIGTFPDGRTYHAFLGPNQGVPLSSTTQQVSPNCSPCPGTALHYQFGWVQDTVHAYNLYWEPSGSYSGYNSWMSGYFTNSNGTDYRVTLTQYSQQIPPAPSPTYVTKNAYVYANQNDTYAYSTYSPSHPSWITDAEVVAEIKRVGIGYGDSHNAQINVFLASGEQVCTDNNGTPLNCFPGAGGCGYHSSFRWSDGNNYAYTLIPFGHTSSCYVSNPPNGPDTDTALTILSHESFETTTDPTPGQGWIDQYGQEIGDKCAWAMGQLNYDAGKANHYWASSYYLLQMEYTNHIQTDFNAGYCTQYGI